VDFSNIVQTVKQRSDSAHQWAAGQDVETIRKRIVSSLRLPSDLFESARLKLTAFYFGVLVVFCLVLTFGVRWITSYELSRGGDAERGIVHQLFQQYYTKTNDTPALTYPGDPGDQYFIDTQQQQANVTRNDLNRDFFVFDLTLLGAGAVVSYWYAGRTLRPIEEVHEQQKRFTSDASHELRTPLASMRLENEVFLRQKAFSEQDARDQIASNLEEVERLEKLANNLLALSRFETAPMAHTQVVVGEIIDESVGRIKHRPDVKHIAFVKDVVPAKIDVNRESMVELVTILLDNAVKYGPKNGKIEIGGTLQDDTYVLTVRDHGTGITEFDLPHIFERMYRGDKARSSRVGGHGIGLSLARQIAEANEATLNASNASSGGAVFKLTVH
jgi:signal transduction histidine kinase